MEATLFDLPTVGSHLLRLGLAFVLALPIGVNRETKSKPKLGLRTFPLVAMASCGYVLLGQVIFVDYVGDQARILQGLITGVGFLGGGAIVKEGTNVRGTATAAAIWSTAAIGAAAAYDRYEIAAALALVTTLILFGLPPVKQQLAEPEEGAAGIEKGKDGRQEEAPPAS